jgi:hypothetical protein
METTKIRWFIDKNNNIFQVHPSFDGGTNACFDADVTPDRIRELTPIDHWGNLYDIVNTYMTHDSFAKLVDANESVFKQYEGCFIDVDGVVHLISSIENNLSTAPYTVICEGDTVIHCGDYLEGDGYAVNEEYTLHRSISGFAAIMDAA